MTANQARLQEIAQRAKEETDFRLACVDARLGLHNLDPDDKAELDRTKPALFDQVKRILAGRPVEIQSGTPVPHSKACGAPK